MKLEWKINCRSSASKLYSLLTTKEGRESFWATSAPEVGSEIHFSFPNGEKTISEILTKVENKEFIITYFGSVVKFELQEQDDGYTILTLTSTDIPEYEYTEVKAGWVSVLMNLKAASDFKTDLRNNDPTKTWTQNFADN